MESTSRTAAQDPRNIASSISYECHSLVFHLEMMKLLAFEDVSDDEDTEYESKSDASENKSEDYFEEDLFGSTFNNGKASSSEAFQRHANTRKVHAITNGLNLLTFDLIPDLEESGEDIQDELSEEEKDNAPIVTNITDFVLHHEKKETKPHLSSIEEFERQAIEKKIRMGKIKEVNTGMSRFQYIKQYR
uniref:Uncharacterized protein n=1 Tax=Helicotheca tamesis TaxID=374047 RepID=A0A7S2IIG3_9STRA